jgi:hypothetical protein
MARIRLAYSAHDGGLSTSAGVWIAEKDDEKTLEINVPPVVAKILKKKNKNTRQQQQLLEALAKLVGEGFALGQKSSRKKLCD